MSAKDDALDVARFCWPLSFPGGKKKPGTHWPHDGWIAAAERVLVERGLGAEYGAALWEELRLTIPDNVRRPETPSALWTQLAAIRTAPLEVCLRAMARVVREQKPKEKA